MTSWTYEKKNAALDLWSVWMLFWGCEMFVEGLLHNFRRAPWDTFGFYVLALSVSLTLAVAVVVIGQRAVATLMERD